MKFLLLTVALVHCAFASHKPDDATSSSSGDNEPVPKTPREILSGFADVDRDHVVATDVLKNEPNDMQQGGINYQFCEKCNVERDDDPLYPLCPDCKVREDEEQKVQFAELGDLDTTDYEDLRLFSCDPCQTCQTHLDQTSTWKRVSQANQDENCSCCFTISRKAAQMCVLVKQITEGDKAAADIEISKISNVSTPILGLIVEYLNHYDGKVPAEIAKPIRSVQMGKIVADEWDAQFINKQTKKVIFQIILGANYMNIRSLLHLGCAKIATMIKGKSPEEIKKILGDDEEAKVDTRRRLAELSDAFSKFN